MNPIELLDKVYKNNQKAKIILITHGRCVAKKALEIAKNLPHKPPKFDLQFIENAALLHDIGIIQTNIKEFNCTGEFPYICHGILGKKILENENLHKYGLVCERHIGLGLSCDEIIKNNLPLPKRDMLPISLEEKIVCLADKFFSKDRDVIEREKPIEEIKKHAASHSQTQLKRLNILLKELGV